MKRVNDKKKKMGIGARFICYAVFFIVPVILMIFGGNLYAMKLVREEAFNSNITAIKLYSHQVDAILDEIDFGLLNFISQSAEFNELDKDADELESKLEHIELNSMLCRVIDLYPNANALFIYEPTSEMFVCSWNTIDMYRNQNSLREFVSRRLSYPDSPFPSTWSSNMLNGDSYLSRIFRFNGVYIGALVGTDSIVSNLQGVEEASFAHILFRSAAGETMSGDPEARDVSLDGDIDSYFLTGSGTRYMAVGSRCSSGDFDLFALINESDILAGQNFLHKVLLFCILISCVLLVIFIYLIRRTMIEPLLRLSSALKKLPTEEDGVYLEPDNDTAEFDMVYDNFNSMADEIRQLRIDVYEERLSKQKAQLDFYQIQVKPHFFINAINTIYNFAQMGQNDMVMKMSMCIINHFRHTLQNGPMTTLGKELEFTRNYLEMQEIRSSYRLTYQMDADIPPRILEENVPTLVIQTFVDNSIKHTSMRDRYVAVNVKAESVYTPDRTYVKITISDTGDGFSPEILAKLRAGERIIDDRGTHIGIYNVMQRLKLIYKEDAAVLFDNNETSGARVEILFPLSHEGPPELTDDNE